MIKTLSKVDAQGTYLNIIKAIYDKPTANVILDSEKLKAFPTTIPNKDAHPHHFYSTQHWKSQPQQSRSEEEIQGIQIGKEEVKLSLYADDMILYIEKSIKTQTTTAGMFSG